MKGFIINMLSDGNDVSHKRVIAFAAFIILSVLALLSSFGHTAGPDVFIIFASIVGGQSLLTVIEKIKTK